MCLPTVNSTVQHICPSSDHSPLAYLLTLAHLAASKLNYNCHYGNIRVKLFSAFSNILSSVITVHFIALPCLYGQAISTSGWTLKLGSTCLLLLLLHTGCHREAEMCECGCLWTKKFWCRDKQWQNGRIERCSGTMPLASTDFVVSDTTFTLPYSSSFSSFTVHSSAVLPLLVPFPFLSHFQTTTTELFIIWNIVWNQLEECTAAFIVSQKQIRSRRGRAILFVLHCSLSFAFTASLGINQY